VADPRADDELNAAVEAEYEAEKADSIRAGRWGWTPKESIRKRRLQEREQAREAHVRDLQERELRERLAERDEQRWGRQRPRVSGPTAASHGWGTIQRAVELFSERTKVTWAGVTRETGLNHKDVGRVRRLRDGGLLRLDQAGQEGLWVDPRVRQLPGRRIILRYWDEASRHWLDPYSDPPSPV
jgi:hypothetical protein